jgi:4-hydroxy-tetrahydrodipicolinate reductase
VIRVAVLGAAGRMGRLVCQTVVEEPDLELVAAVAPSAAREAVGHLIGHPDVALPLSGDVDDLADVQVDVAVDFTRPDAVMGNVRWLVEHDIHAVVGTSGVEAADLEEIRSMLEAQGGRPNVMIVSNFAIGAVLMQRFAVLAAPFFPAAEVIELHHARKMTLARDEPWREGPAAETVSGVRGGDVEGVRIHSVRLPGLVGHQEVLFGGAGEVLTIRHDSLARTSFMPGVVLAIKAVGSVRGLTVGLEAVLGLESAP